MNRLCETLFAIRDRGDLLEPFVQVHLFGSALISDTPTDVDILLVYRRADMPRVRAASAEFRNTLSRALPGLDVHFTTLSESETTQTKFLDKVAYQQIKG